jgi:RNA repair, ligase-Pnkp-associating, region of Hen1
VNAHRIVSTFKFRFLDSAVLGDQPAGWTRCSEDGDDIAARPDPRLSSPELRLAFQRVMLLTLTTTHSPATDLGFLLHKNPSRLQSFNLTVGRAHVFYPQASPEICTAALMLEIDPVGLVRNRRGPAGEGFSLQQYVNDRPYAASSFLAVAIAQVFSSALADEQRQRQRERCLSGKPWKASTGPRTPAGKARAAANGRRNPPNPQSVRQKQNNPFLFLQTRTLNSRGSFIPVHLP